MVGPHLNSLDPSAPNAGAAPRPASLSTLISSHPFTADQVIIESESGALALGELRDRVEHLAAELRAAGIRAGQPVGNLVRPGASAVVVMFAAWAVGATYVPINRRYTPAEVVAFVTETPVALLVGTEADLARHQVRIGALAYDDDGTALVRPADPAVVSYDPDIALILRTSGTTGRPKAVLLRHTGTLDAIDASLEKLRRRKRAGREAVAQSAGSASPGAKHRMNLIPVSLALWAGVFNTLFTFRAGFGVVLLDRFTTTGFGSAVRTHGITSTVLAPAMISMLTDDDTIDDLAPLQLVRSITAPLSPEVARRFHARFGAFVLNSYGQTELGGEVVGWTADDMRVFAEAKLGAAGRPYDDVQLRIRRDDGGDASVDERGEILVRSPFRMSGYALADGSLDRSDDDRFVDGFLRTGDLGRLDSDGFLWVEGRVSDMINRGGLKVFPDEVEEVLRQYPSVRDAAVAGRPDERLGEVPVAWIVSDEAIDQSVLQAWCRERLAPYKVPVGFTQIDALPRNDIGKLLRRDLIARSAT
jgi:long-chain acyl-CoA synthetase